MAESATSITELLYRISPLAVTDFPEFGRHRNPTFQLKGLIHGLELAFSLPSPNGKSPRLRTFLAVYRQACNYLASPTSIASLLYKIPILPSNPPSPTHINLTTTKHVDSNQDVYRDNPNVHYLQLQGNQEQHLRKASIYILPQLQPQFPTHIEHTHKQLDNNPCPSIVRRYVLTPSTTSKHGSLGCTSTVNCPSSTKELYHFQTWTSSSPVKARLAAFAEFEIDEEAHCWDGEGHANWKHGCEMGSKWEGTPHMVWKHLNGPDGKGGVRPRIKQEEGVDVGMSDGAKENDGTWVKKKTKGALTLIKVPQIKVEPADDDIDMAG
ncbi:hypothetical protein BDZ45DRAFT_739383 [Acephala macrosclerotiorum]|nr:hypothetical protein BDZ45DRAFT_739383 [Acephala macrosclerotiorum]